MWVGVGGGGPQDSFVCCGTLSLNAHQQVITLCLCCVSVSVVASTNRPTRQNDDARLKIEFRDLIVRLLAEASLLFPVDARLLSWKLDNIFLMTLSRAHRMCTEATGGKREPSSSSSSRRSSDLLERRDECLKEIGVPTRLYEAYTSWSMSKKIRMFFISMYFLYISCRFLRGFQLYFAHLSPAGLHVLRIVMNKLFALHPLQGAYFFFS